MNGVLPMSDELDTSWFDLKKYDELNKLDLLGWHCQLIDRMYEYNKSKLIKRIKETPIFSTDGHERYFGWKYSSRYSFNTSSVESTKAFDFLSYANHDNLKDVSMCHRVYTDEAMAIVDTPINLLGKDRGMDNLGFDSFVTVDLTASDEQIMSDFKHWLTEYRKSTGYKSSKKDFTDNDLLYWVKYRVLPYIDLTLIAEFEGKKITQEKVARLIFPDEYDVDIIDRLRKVTIPKAEYLLNDLEGISTIDIIQAQISACNTKK